jgi:IclR family transcriptional regulator, acetate operon repressor
VRHEGFEDALVPRAATDKTNSMTGVRAIDRAVAVLQAFTADKPSMSVLELQEKVSLSRPTLYRLLETLAAHGFVRAHGTPQRFSLDYAVGRLAQNWLTGLDPVAAARPVLERLHERTQETVALAVLRGHQHLYVLELISPHVMSMSRGIGPLDHLTRGASGKSILAFMSEKDIDAVLRTAPKDTNRKALFADLAAIRRDRFWVARSEIFSGAVGIAAPYFSHANEVAGSIIVFGPEVRFSEERSAMTTRLVLEGAAEISAALGHVSSRQIPPKPPSGKAQLPGRHTLTQRQRESP